LNDAMSPRDYTMSDFQRIGVAMKQVLLYSCSHNWKYYV
jgi:hypothetical protein